MASFFVVSEKGSALYLAIGTIALTGFMILGAMEISKRMSTEASRAQQKDSEDKFNQFVESLAVDPDSCIGLPSPSHLTGLTFVNPTTNAVGQDQFVLNAGSAEQEVRFGSNIADTTGAFVLKGSDRADMTKPTFANFNNLVIDKLFINNYRPLSGGGAQVDLLQTSSVSGTPFAPRLLGSLVLGFSGATLNACVLKESAQAVCESMGCSFNAAISGQKCNCGLPAMSCPQTAGEPMQYIGGIDYTSGTPQAICRTFKVSCLDPLHGGKGVPGFALSGIDRTGKPICQPVEGVAVAVAATASPSPSPAPSPSASPSPGLPAGMTIAWSGCTGPFASYFTTPDPTGQCASGMVGVYPDGFGCWSNAVCL